MSDRLVGTTIDGLVIVRQIGVGGFANVYEARDEAGAGFAIKVLDAERVDAVAIARFEREVAIVKQLRHRNIVALHGAGALGDGRPYCVMELLEGDDLGWVLASGPLPPHEIVDIVESVASALAAAHAARVVHRDVKASNVFRCRDRRVVLLDFGIAKLAVDAEVLTRRGETVGTFGSMSPEQLTGRAVDARTDVYGLGALLHHMITGVLPFQGHAADVGAQLHRFAERPLASTRGAPVAIDPIIVKAMAIRPDDRFATAHELAVAVAAALATGYSSS